MTVYCVSYDLNKSGQNYVGLYEELKKYDNIHPLDSTCFVSTTETPTQVAAKLRARMDANDYMIVIKVSKPYDGWLSQTYWDWLNARTT